MSEECEFVELGDVQVVRETKAALCIAYDGQAFWVPRSLVLGGDCYEAGDNKVTLWIETWFARKLELI